MAANLKLMTDILMNNDNDLGDDDYDDDEEKQEANYDDQPIKMNFDKSRHNMYCT